MVARQGRELQRYSDSTGGRVVVGCIPYRPRAGSDGGEVEVLVISSQKKGPAGGRWTSRWTRRPGARPRRRPAWWARRAPPLAGGATDPRRCFPMRRSTRWAEARGGAEGRRRAAGSGRRRGGEMEGGRVRGWEGTGERGRRRRKGISVFKQV
ncbi:hypothetical protein BAE44_0005628 [Dichanthelium oligosanthes]|uniref:Uncharacterized protein n=1 Tax=Dichanthelium oligosanthes TaxID=888268 RepID=A0A1E5W7B1_9POAL|nr:hypothetical protein BAE44_0005628 [Dichanthelium oligosanthes]